jgi:hypothetical protein
VKKPQSPGPMTRQTPISQLAASITPDASWVVRNHPPPPTTKDRIPQRSSTTAPAARNPRSSTLAEIPNPLPFRAQHPPPPPKETAIAGLLSRPAKLSLAVQLAGRTLGFLHGARGWERDCGSGSEADRPRLEISPQRFAGGTAQAHSTDADAARLTKKEGRHGREMDAWVACAACDPCLPCFAV